jgi:GT2 family glycosyltransferase
LVYVLVLNYRSWQDTLACLEALGRLKYSNFRVLVLDNASPNDSVPRIQTAFPNIELIRLERNLGFAGGNNLGLRRALAEGAEYVWLLNPDTLPEPRALSAMVGLAQRDPQVGAVGSVLYETDDPQRVQVWGGGEVVLNGGLIRLLSGPHQLPRLSYISGASLLLPRAALERVGLLDEGFFMYGEDADYGLRLTKAGFRLAVAEGSRVLHKGGTSWGGANLVADEHFAAANLRLFRKHAPFPLLAAAGYCVFWTLEYGLRRRWASIAALWRGARTGWSSPIREEPWKS